VHASHTHRPSRQRITERTDVRVLAATRAAATDTSAGRNTRHPDKVRRQEQGRGLYDAFHLDLRYSDLTSALDLRVTTTGETATPPSRLSSEHRRLKVISLRILCVPGAGLAKHLKRRRPRAGLVSS
jgi:hypothetical protein